VAPVVVDALAGVTATATTGTAAAVPVSATACGLEAALSVSVIAPVRVPEAVGVKVTEIVQLAFAARLAPQVFVCA